MATRSRIGIADPQGNITSIYCHFDGYPSYIGRLLQTTYNTEEDAREIVSLGNLSSLDERLHPASDSPHSFHQRVPGVTVAYGRDRGDEDTDAKEHTDEDWPDWGQEFLYLWINGLGWHYREQEAAGWKLLAPAISE